MAFDRAGITRESLLVYTQEIREVEIFERTNRRVDKNSYGLSRQSHSRDSGFDSFQCCLICWANNSRERWMLY